MGGKGPTDGLITAASQGELSRSWSQGQGWETNTGTLGGMQAPEFSS